MCCFGRLRPAARRARGGGRTGRWVCCAARPGKIARGGPRTHRPHGAAREHHDAACDSGEVLCVCVCVCVCVCMRACVRVRVLKVTFLCRPRPRAQTGGPPFGRQRAVRCKAHERPKQRHVSGFKQFAQGPYGNRRRNGRFSFFLGRMMLVQIGGGPRSHCGKKNNHGPTCDCGPGGGPKKWKGPHNRTCATRLLPGGNLQRNPQPPKVPSAQISKNDDGPPECICGPGGGPISGKGQHKDFCATKVAGDKWQRYPPPKAPPAQAVLVKTFENARET